MASTQETSASTSSYERKPSKTKSYLPRFYTFLIKGCENETHLIEEEVISKVSYTKMVIEKMCETYKKSYADEYGLDCKPNDDGENFVFTVLMTEHDTLEEIEYFYKDCVLFGDNPLISEELSNQLKKLGEEQNPTLVKILNKPIIPLDDRGDVTGNLGLLSPETKEKFEKMRGCAYENLGTCLVYNPKIPMTGSFVIEPHPLLPTQSHFGHQPSSPSLFESALSIISRPFSRAEKHFLSLSFPKPHHKKNHSIKKPKLTSICPSLRQDSQEKKLFTTI